MLRSWAWCLCFLLLISCEAQAQIVPRQPLVLTTLAPSFSTPFVAIDRLTNTLEVRISRPTTLTPRLWTATSPITVSIIVRLGPEEYRAVGSTRGGIRVNQLGVEFGEYVLRYTLPAGFFGARSGPQVRLGQRSLADAYEARLEILLGSGSVTSDVLMTSTTAPAPLGSFRSSVAFDAATSAQESSGDGVITVLHTSAGSNRGVFAGNANASATPQPSTSITYGGTAMVEMWDLGGGSFHRQAGYQLAAQATGLQTVVSTLAGSVGEHYIGVVSMTGVHQTVPVGTSVTATGTNTTPTVTVASVGNDDMVVDTMFAGDGLADTATPGADQTQRNSEFNATFGISFRQSTQPGTAGGVMSWTLNVAPSFTWIEGAVAFKPASLLPCPSSRPIPLPCPIGDGQ